MNQRNDQGQTPLHFAVIKKNREAVKMLLAHQDIEVDAGDVNGRTPLWTAVAAGDASIAMLLLEKNARVNDADKDGITPLYLAAQDGWVDLVEQFVKRGACVNAVTINDDATPLYIATQEGHKEVVKRLLELGADPNIFRKNGLTPLFKAAELGCVEIVQYLLMRNADPNRSRFSDNVTPLLMASERGHIEVVGMLLRAGANPSLVRKPDNLPPLYRAICNGHLDVAELLIKNGADPLQPLDDGCSLPTIALYKGFVPFTRALLSGGASIQRSLNRGYTFLRAAVDSAAADSAEVIALLEENKEALRGLCGQKDLTGGHPMHYAALKGNSSVLEFCMRLGADINALNRYGETPAYLAAREGNAAVLKLLFKRGADFSIKNDLGLTPLDIAQANGHAGIRKYLKKQCEALLRVPQLLCASDSSSSESIDQGESENDWSIVEEEPVPVPVASSSASRTQKHSPQGSARRRQKIVALDPKVLCTFDRTYECSDYVAVRQRDQYMTLIVYKEKQKLARVSTRTIGNISGKQNKFHMFADEVDTYLPQGIRIDVRSQAQHQALLDDLGIRPLTGGQHAIIVQGKIEGAHYQHQHALRDRNAQTYGYSGAFVYLFSAEGTCYHRCFHQNKLSKQQHSFENIEMN